MGDQPSPDDLLSRCGRDLTALARAGQLKRAYSRDRAVRTVLRILASDVRHNPLIVGPARCGKTAVVYEAVRRLATGDGPEPLCRRRVVEMTPDSILNGLGFGSGWRANLDRLLDQLERNGGYILFLRDAHEVARADDMAVFLAPYLTRSHLYWIAEGLDWRTFDLCHRRPVWSHAFVRLPLGDVSPEETRRILDDVCDEVYMLRDIVVETPARVAIVEMCQRFVPGQAFPGKAVDLLEDVLAAASGTAGGRHITPDDVFRRFSERTGLHRAFLDAAVPFPEAEVHDYLAQRVLGQEIGVGVLAQVLERVHAGLGERTGPLGVFLFVGPSGVGKTELARTLARFLFGGEDRLVCFPMADYADPAQGVLLFGDTDRRKPEADRRGQLTLHLGTDGLRVVLLDEFDRAHKSIRAHLLQLLDDGLFTNGMGELVPLRSVVFVLAVNDPSFLPADPVGFLFGEEDSAALVARGLRWAEEHLPPKSIGRLDGVCPFLPLTPDDRRRIAFRMAREVLAAQGLPRRGVEVDLEGRAIEWLLEQGYSLEQGAKHLKHRIEDSLTGAVAQVLQSQPAPPDQTLRLYVRQGRAEAAFAPEDDTVVTARDEAGQWTLAHVHAAISALAERLTALEARDQADQAQTRVDDLLRTVSRHGFWDGKGVTREQLTELEQLSRRAERARALRRALAELQGLLSEAMDGRDPDLTWQALRAYAGLEHDLNAAELESCLTGPWDRRDALLLIRPDGDSPKDRAWVTDFARMILAWAQLHRLDGFEATVWDETPARVDAGPASIAILVQGEGAYGFLKGEAGTHQLIQGVKRGAERVKEVLRAWVVALPAWSDDELVAVPEPDILVRSRPLRAGGTLLPRLHSQAVAVHRPSETVVSCTCDQPPAEVEARAIRLVRALLTGRAAGLLDPPSQPVWGTVVRTYDQYHSNQARDRRTGHVVKDVRQVLAGHIDGFLAASLRERSA